MPNITDAPTDGNEIGAFLKILCTKARLFIVLGDDANAQIVAGKADNLSGGPHSFRKVVRVKDAHAAEIFRNKVGVNGGIFADPNGMLAGIDRDEIVAVVISLSCAVTYVLRRSDLPVDNVDILSAWASAAG